MNSTSRRCFLQRIGFSTLAIAFSPPPLLAARMSALRFGLCADVHKDVMHDADERMKRFVERMDEDAADFICQMGDFCQPLERNRSFLREFEAFPRETFHVLGNHDMDGGATRDETRGFWALKEPYYTFVRKGCRFIVLDGNDVHEEAPPGYARHVGKEQQAWLARTLEESEEAVIVFSHQSLENGKGVDNGAEVRAILEEANRAAGWGRVLACFSGHHHLDDLRPVGGIPYVQVNSMSYYWVGGGKRHQSYVPEVHAQHPWIEYTSPYKDPLWVSVTLDPAGSVLIEGVRSSWVGPSPAELGVEEGPNSRGIRPHASDRRLKLARRPDDADGGEDD